MESAQGIVRHIQTAQDPIVLRSFRGADKGTFAMAFDPHMRTVAGAGADNVVHVYSFKPQQRQFKFVGHTAPIHALAYSPDGETIVSGGEDRSIKFWKNNIYGKCKSVKGHIGAVRSISFSTCGSFITSSSDDKTIKGWNVREKKFMFTMSGHTNWVRSARLAPDTRLLVSGSDDATVRLWDVSTAKEINRFKESQQAVYSVDWISDGTTVCGGGLDGKVNLWDVRSMKLIQHYDVCRRAVNSVVTHPSGVYLATGDEDSVVKIFDLRQGRLAWSLYQQKGAVKQVEFNKAGDYFASCGLDVNNYIWKSNFDESIKATQVVNFIQEEAQTSFGGSSQYLQAKNVTTQTAFKANKGYNFPTKVVDQSDTKVVYKTPQEKQQESISVALSGQFEKVVNQLERITQIMVQLDFRITNNEKEVAKLFENPKCQKLLAQYEEMFKNTTQVQAVWENFQQMSVQHQPPKNRLQQTFQDDFFGNEPNLETGSFIRQGLVEDYPEESDQKLQQEYERERQQFADSPTLTLQGPNQFYGTNPFQSNALQSTFNQFMQTGNQTFTTRMNLKDQLESLSTWKNELEEVKREIAAQDQQVIREAVEADEEEEQHPFRQLQEQDYNNYEQEQQQEDYQEQEEQQFENQEDQFNDDLQQYEDQPQDEDLPQDEDQQQDEQVNEARFEEDEQFGDN